MSLEYSPQTSTVSFRSHNPLSLVPTEAAGSFGLNTCIVDISLVLPQE
jgi:hypothetical protein